MPEVNKGEHHSSLIRNAQLMSADSIRIEVRDGLKDRILFSVY